MTKFCVFFSSSAALNQTVCLAENELVSFFPPLIIRLRRSGPRIRKWQGAMLGPGLSHRTSRQFEGSFAGMEADKYSCCEISRAT